jgi:hypothetical protein
MRYLYLVILVIVLFVSTLSAQIESLPVPIINNKSFEILSNNRYSVHSGFTSSLSNQILSNALWATNKAPRIGTYREIYVATPTNVYRYDTTNHTLVLHLAGNHRYSSGSAFEIGMASDRHEETGFMTQAGLLAGHAFRDAGATSNVVSCPMKYAADYASSNWNPTHPIKCVNVYGRYNNTALDTTCLAVSSNSSLPLPRTNGADTFETVLSRFTQDSVFSSAGLSLQAISQLAWAGYGVAPHMAFGRRGLTVPSAIAAYYLTKKIYIVRDVGVDRYNNRTPPGTSLSTADHRLEQITSEDRRPQLRSTSTKIPSRAPVYFIICVGDTASYGPMQEAGYVGFQLLMQAEILGLNGYLTAPLNRTERTAIISALSIPTSDIPAIVFSCGQPATNINESGSNPIEIDGIKVASPNSGQVQIEYWLVNSGTSELSIFDLTGRLVYSLNKEFNPAGHYTIKWNGKNNSGQKVSPGVYVCQLTKDNKTHSAQIILTK